MVVNMRLFISFTNFILLALLTFSCTAGSMSAHFINIGQGDATLLEFDCGVVLIDAGSQVSSNAVSTRKLMNYLRGFFKRRDDLNDTINTILITHNHMDHTESLDEVSKEYTIKNIVSTKKNDSDVKDTISTESGIKHKYVTYKDAIDKKPNGLFYSEIDPFDCDGDGPEIKIFTGLVDVPPGSTTTVNGKKFYPSHFSNPNNQSLVIRVKYGKVSFLFTGDLQKKGIKYLLANYHDNLDLFDVDVYQVGHHASHNATNEELLSAMKPKIAVISAGNPTDHSNGSAWDHGHPNEEAIKLLMNSSSIKSRRPSITGLVFSEQETAPFAYEITKEIYCTCWEDNIVIEADPTTGKYKVKTNQ